MHITDLPGLAEDLRTLPAEGPARDRHVYRLIDFHASADAAAAVHAAAARPPVDGLFAAAVTAAAAVLRTAPTAPSAGETAARERFRDVVTSAEFLALIRSWIRDLRQLASTQPETGACTLASALDLWSWTVNYFRSGEGCSGPSPSVALDELAEVFTPLLAARCLAAEVATAQSELRRDLCHVNAARVSASAAATCAELVFGYRRHLVWDAEGCATCFRSDELDELEAVMPGLAAGAGAMVDVVENDGAHPAKAGPCARFTGVETFQALRNKLDGCLTGARIAKDRAAMALARPEVQA